MLMRRSKNAEANKAYPVIAMVLFQCEYKDLAQPNNFISLFTVQLWFLLFLLFYKQRRLDFLASFFSKTKRKSVKKLSGHCSMNEGKVTCKNSGSFEQNEKTA